VVRHLWSRWQWDSRGGFRANLWWDWTLVEDGWAGYTNPIRLIVVRTPHNPKRVHRIGKRIGDFIYELFITSPAQASLTGPDILSLYYGRGGFEKQLGDEDREGDCDRWCSWHPEGQEFWQILSQWVWNWRLWVGLAYHPPMEVCSAWARSIGKFSGQDFKLLDERTLQCPARQHMYRREVRQNRAGDLLILFGLTPRTCQQCPLQERCLAEGSTGTAGRRVTVIRKKRPPEPNRPNPVSP
jgi:hypothetical protein